MNSRSVSFLPFTISIGLLICLASSAVADPIVSASGVRGGLVVHLGAGDGKASAAFRVNESYIVHGLEADAVKVAAARDRLGKEGLYGPVSIRQWSSGALPYADDMVNLLVADSLGAVPMGEVMRVLAPRGVAMIGGKKTIKPWPKDMDEWPQYLHDSGNTRTANDTRVGPPRRLRWHAGPWWSRSHEFTSSIATMVTGAGRIFYVFDQGLSGITGKQIPERWTLIARDAHNGVLLWKKPLRDWGSQAWRSTSLRGLPRGVMRRLVVDGDKLYITLGYFSPISVLDAANGELLKTFKQTDRTDEIVMHDTAILARIRAGAENSLMLLDKSTGKTLWRVKEPHVVQHSLAVNDHGVFYSSGSKVSGRSLADGKLKWQANLAAPDPKKRQPKKGKGKKKRKPRAGRSGSLVLADSKVLVHGPGNKLWAFDAGSGKVLWKTNGGGRDLFVANGRAWQNYLTGVDLETGKAAVNVDTKDIFSKGHHPRCYNSRATTKYVISPNRGTEFISMTGGESYQNDWLRGPCSYGVLPSNGLLYAAPHPCLCYGGVMLLGFNALAPIDKNETTPAFGGKLIKGPAYGSAISKSTSPSDWPTYRHDARRTGASSQAVGGRVSSQWTCKIGGKLTPPVFADGKLFISAKSQQRIIALDAASGKEAWGFTPDARVDSPPTIHLGQVLFGCADGWVYCLRASDGVLAWRFQAAPAERMIIVKNQLESPWRVHGSVLIHEGLVYVTAGRSSYLDGGIRVYAIDPRTGSVVHKNRIGTTSATRKDAEGKPFNPAFHIEGAHSDILVSQGGYIYLSQVKFDSSLKRMEVPYVKPDPKLAGIDILKKPYTVPGYHSEHTGKKGYAAFAAVEVKRGHNGDRRMGLHVLNKSSFLDDTYYNRTYWMYGRDWPGFQHAHRAARSGQILVVGPKITYAVQAFPSRDKLTPRMDPGTQGYLLLADSNDAGPVLDYAAHDKDKGIGYTRTEDPVWFKWVKLRITAMTLAKDTLFVAGPPDILDPSDPMSAFEGRKGVQLWAVSTKDGAKLSETKLPGLPVFDGMITAGGKLFVVLQNGSVLCLK